MNTKYFYGLEWLRFFMALYMVVYHLGGLYKDAPPLFQQLVGMGFYATSTFFVLSGFLLAHVYLDSNGGMKGNPKGFIAKRLCNLYPIHVITLLFALVMLTFQQSPGDGVTVYYNHHPFASVDDTQLENLLPPLGWLAAGSNLILQIFLLQSWEPRFLWLNGATWSISALLFFYLLFPFLAPRLMAVRRWLLAALLVWGVYLLAPILATWLGAYDYVTVGIMHRNPIVRLPEFIFGILLCRALKEQAVAAWVQRHCYLLLFGGLASLMAGAWLLRMNGKLWFYPLHNGLLLPFQGMLLLGCCAFAAPRNHRLRRIGQRLGEASLCIFAIQTPLINLLKPLTEHVLSWLDKALDMVDDVSDAFSDAGDVVSDALANVHIPLWLMVPHLLLIIAFGVLSQSYLVKPLRNWLENQLPASWRYRQLTSVEVPASHGRNDQTGRPD